MSELFNRIQELVSQQQILISEHGYDEESPAFVVTAYRPDPARWSSDFLRRRT